jgi:hypothetical protein
MHANRSHLLALLLKRTTLRLSARRFCCSHRCTWRRQGERRTHLRRINVAVLLTFAMVGLGFGTPAFGESWNRQDPRNDGFRGGEIIRLDAANGPEAVHVRAKFANLDRGKVRDTILVIDTHRRDGQDYMVFSRWTGSEVRRSLYRTVPYSDANARKIPCPRMEAHWRTSSDVMTFRMPQNCLTRPSGPVRVGFHAQGRKPGYGSDWAPGRFLHYSSWLRQG